MRLIDALSPLISDPNGGIIALVGGGGKSAALFALGEEVAADGRDVVLTTTTHILDPRLEAKRQFDRVIIDARYAEPAGRQPKHPDAWDLPAPLPEGGRRIVLSAGEAPQTGKLKGIHPSQSAALRRDWGFIVVEADGARQRPIKAPASHEPVLPAAVDVVLGVVGLDCLEQPMDGATVHRPECFGALTGCAVGAPIGPAHIAALVSAPQGLFKGAPGGSRRVLVLNKADRCASTLPELLDAWQVLAPPCVDLILVCTLAEQNPAKRVRAHVKPGSSSL